MNETDFLLKDIEKSGTKPIIVVFILGIIIASTYPILLAIDSYLHSIRCY